MIYIEPLTQEYHEHEDGYGADTLVRRTSRYSCSPARARNSNSVVVSAYRGGSEPYGIYLDEGVCGQVGEVRLVEPDGDCCSFTDLQVADAFRGKGYGKAALRCVLEKFRRDGKYRRVRIHVNASNEAALNLYERSGFYATGFADLDHTLVVMERRI
ncbi:MAG: GNAT family N-acetyltransferase [Oscillospiraceae bacterium]|jgi:ribosomal protein S18 acetylase RimI-like enzyme|nr:GNAT family N-acetyltransferase [Oscillospiraceae bacterium]